MTNAVFLGPNVLKWCDNCNIPILLFKKCSICDNETRKVVITPPFDVRPAIFGLKQLKDTIEKSYGKGSSAFLDSKIVLFNRAPELDALDEVIVDGYVIGKLRFDLSRLDWEFKPTVEGAVRMYNKLKKYPKWVLIDDTAISYIRKGANVLAPGILDADQAIKKGDFVFVIDSAENLIAIGRCRYSYNEFSTMKKGVVIKNLESVKEDYRPSILKNGQTWEIVIKANSLYLEKKEKTSRKILKNAINKYPDYPVVVSFSGGKDSLCSLLITIEELGNNFYIMFLDTGLEFPETIEYTNRIIKSLGLESKLIIGKSGNIFWDNLPKYGFPSRDFRWCNKLLKLNIVKKIIMEKFNGKILTIVGARKVESRTRYNEKVISFNKNIPDQINVNIIQNWSTLTVWLYIFKKKVDFNPIYKYNFNRIGCWLCPSNKMSELETLKKIHPELYEKLIKELEIFREKIGASDEFIKYGFWRWRKTSQGMRSFAKKLKISLEVDYSNFEEFNW
ncbi:MAG: phosphoadenosine phosphosulfate reductase domain-containing protein [Candidatus Helarchaeota archaeon]